jgi:hypothetical protein
MQRLANVHVNNCVKESGEDVASRQREGPRKSFGMWTLVLGAWESEVVLTEGADGFELARIWQSRSGFTHMHRVWGEGGMETNRTESSICVCIEEETSCRQLTRLSRKRSQSNSLHYRTQTG